MRDMNFIFIFLGLSFLIATLFSQNYYMNLNFSDGTTVTIPIEEINKITFEGLTNIKDVKKFQGILKTFTLFQNYPNPFNPTTTISYTISQSGNVEITIFNVTGQLIKTIQKKHDSAGSYSTEWDGKNNQGISVATGLYIYQAKFGNSLLAKKMLIIK